jgi:hypothetical protein
MWNTERKRKRERERKKKKTKRHARVLLIQFRAAMNPIVVLGRATTTGGRDDSGASLLGRSHLSSSFFSLSLSLFFFFAFARPFFV